MSDQESDSFEASLTKPEAQTQTEVGEQKCENCARLEQKLEELQENTIVQSMNEMKQRYEDMADMSVCRCVVDFAESSYNEFLDVLTTVHTSLGAVRDKIDTMKHMHVCQSAVERYKPGLENIDFVLRHIQDVIKRVDNVRQRIPFPQSRCMSDCMDELDDDVSL